MKKPCAYLAFVFSAGLAMAPASAQDDIAALGKLDCRLTETRNSTNWIVELDDSIPIAVLDDNDLPAEYTRHHIQIRISLAGPTLTIGRVTGRLLLSDQQGHPLGSGHCRPVSYI